MFSASILIVSPAKSKTGASVSLAGGGGSFSEEDFPPFATVPSAESADLADFDEDEESSKFPAEAQEKSSEAAASSEKSANAFFVIFI